MYTPHKPPTKGPGGAEGFRGVVMIVQVMKEFKIVYDSLVDVKL